MTYNMGDFQGYSQPSMGQPPMGQPPMGQQTQQRYPQLSRVLQTEEGFARSVAYSGAAAKVIPSVLTVAILALVYNIVITVQSITHYGTSWNYFIDVFFSVRSTNNTVDPWLVFWVYAPVVLIPVLIILLIVRKVTYHSSVARLRDDYMRGGFLADLLPTGVPVPMGNRRGVLYLIGAPNVAPESTQAAVQRIVGIATSDPKSRETKAYVGALAKLAAVGAGEQASQASQADPAIMPGIFLTAQITVVDGRPRVAVPIGNDFTKLRLYRLKKDAPVA